MREIKLLSFILWMSGALACVVGHAGPAPTSGRPAHYEQLLKEITSVEFSIGSLTPNNFESMLAYIHATENGRGLSVLDLRSLERTRLARDLTNEVTQLHGWSPDDRYLVFTQTLPPGSEKSNPFKLRESWLTILDSQTRAIRRLMPCQGVLEPYFWWLGTNKYLFVSRRLTNDFAEMFLGSMDNSEVYKVSNHLPELVLMSENKAAGISKRNIATIELKPLEYPDGKEKLPAFEPLSAFSTNEFDQIRWLRYSSGASKFLFCARRAGAQWRHLFEFDPVTRQLSQRSHDDTYNGQWLQQGSGVAYVINTNNGFYLALRPKDPKSHTNLFKDGGVANYTVGPRGETVYVTAAQRAEPHGIWAYNLANSGLRSLSHGFAAAMSLAKSITPEQFKVSSFDGLQVPCFLLKPPSPTGRARSPAVIWVPPATWQFQKSYDERAQFLANLGFFFLAVNYRGCDGYGRDYSALADPKKAAKDILAAHKYLLKDPSVEPQNVFLCTSSAGSTVVSELLALEPGLWRGVAMDKPVSAGLDHRMSGKRHPPLLVIVGDADPAFEAIREFESRAARRKMPVRMHVHTNSAHFTYKTDERRNSLDQIARFFLESIK